MRFRFYQILLLLWALVPVIALGTPVGANDLEHEITTNRLAVSEFQDIAAEAKRRGLRVYILGGGAASVAEHAKANVLATQGHLPADKSRLAWNLPNIVLPEQDIDLVITKANGGPETVAEINDFRDWVRREYPYEFDGRSRWDVLGLKTADPQGHKMALQGNADFLNQNNDSLSLGLLELTDPPKGQSVISDLAHPGAFLRDAAGDELHFYRNPKHAQTAYYQQGRNPEIISAIRTLEKATRYEKGVDPAGVKAIQNIIRQWDPNDAQPGDYVHNYLSGRAKRVISHARNLHQAADIVEITGLRDKLEKLPLADKNQVDSVAWWMNKKPLPKKAPVGNAAAAFVPTGQTAQDLGIQYVTHWTSYPGHRLLTWNYDGSPRLFESRDAVPGEGAVLGDGFYSYKNSETNTTYGPRNKDAMVTFAVDPKAREGVDFVVHDSNVVVWQNSSALSVMHAPTAYPGQMSCTGFYTSLGASRNSFVAGRSSGAGVAGFSRPAGRLNYSPPPAAYAGTINNPGAGAGMHLLGAAARPLTRAAHSADDALWNVLPTYNLKPAVKADFDALQILVSSRRSPVTIQELSAVAAQHHGKGLDIHTSLLLSDLVKSDRKLMAQVDYQTNLMKRLGQGTWAKQVEALPFLAFSPESKKILDTRKARVLAGFDHDKKKLKEFSEKHPIVTVGAQTAAIAGGVSAVGYYLGNKLNDAKDADLDGVLNENDHCPGTPPKTAVNTIGCANGQGFDFSLRNDPLQDEASLASYLRAYPELNVIIGGPNAKKLKAALEKKQGFDSHRISTTNTEAGQPATARLLR